MWILLIVGYFIAALITATKGLLHAYVALKLGRHRMGMDEKHPWYVADYGTPSPWGTFAFAFFGFPVFILRAYVLKASRRVITRIEEGEALDAEVKRLEKAGML